MAKDGKYSPKRRNRPRTDEPLEAVNWKLPTSAITKLNSYSEKVGRSFSWVVSDLIDTLPASLVRVEARHEAERKGLPPPPES